MSTDTNSPTPCPMDKLTSYIEDQEQKLEMAIDAQSTFQDKKRKALDELAETFKEEETKLDEAIAKLDFKKLGNMKIFVTLLKENTPVVTPKEPEWIGLLLDGDSKEWEEVNKIGWSGGEYEEMKKLAQKIRSSAIEVCTDVVVSGAAKGNKGSETVFDVPVDWSDDAAWDDADGFTVTYGKDDWEDVEYFDNHDKQWDDHVGSVLDEIQIEDTDLDAASFTFTTTVTIPALFYPPLGETVERNAKKQKTK